jgi:sec-independent protein translocase protein TatB
MFGLGFGEIVIILVLALVLLGPQKLPEVAKQLGKGMRDFKKASDDLKGQFEKEFYADERRAERARVAPPTAAAPVAAAPPGPVPVAAADNVPGLEAALIDPAAPAVPPVAPPVGTPAAPPPAPPVEPTPPA